jgi:hypothetical protein
MSVPARRRFLSHATLLAASPVVVSARLDVSREIWQLRRERMQSAHAKDIATWSRLTADDWMLYDHDGTKVTKRQRIQDILAGRSGGVLPGPTPTGDWAVRTYGDTALATFTGRTGRHVLFVAARQRGRWVAVHEQQTPIGTPTR